MPNLYYPRRHCSPGMNPFGCLWALLLAIVMAACVFGWIVGGHH